MKMISLRYH